MKESCVSFPSLTSACWRAWSCWRFLLFKMSLSIPLSPVRSSEQAIAIKWRCHTVCEINNFYCLFLNFQYVVITKYFRVESESVLNRINWRYRNELIWLELKKQNCAFIQHLEHNWASKTTMWCLNIICHNLKLFMKFKLWFDPSLISASQTFVFSSLVSFNGRASSCTALRQSAG